MPDGDAAKTLRQAARLYERLLASGADRGSVVVALGGGAVGDLAGFAAATYLRGVAFVQVPTTVLAMVDASIGGKVAVNLPQGKNLVGAFHQPRLVWIDVATLRSLPVRARAAGLAEVVKAAAIRDAGFFADLERDAERLLALDDAALLPALERACAIKAEVVSRDEREQGLRMLLNFGHTLAHAVEALMGYRRVLHGEAVSMGMVFAARRSEQLGCAPAGTAARLCALLARLGLPTELPARPRSAYLRALKVDKKRRDARIHYIVLRGIGRAEAVPLTAAEILPGPPGRPRCQGGRGRDAALRAGTEARAARPRAAADACALAEAQRRAGRACGGRARRAPRARARARARCGCAWCSRSRCSTSAARDAARDELERGAGRGGRSSRRELSEQELDAAFEQRRARGRAADGCRPRGASRRCARPSSGPRTRSRRPARGLGVRDAHDGGAARAPGRSRGRGAHPQPARALARRRRRAPSANDRRGRVVRELERWLANLRTEA